MEGVTPFMKEENKFWLNKFVFFVTSTLVNHRVCFNKFSYDMRGVFILSLFRAGYGQILGVRTRLILGRRVGAEVQPLKKSNS